jgi:hypothetical protein
MTAAATPDTPVSCRRLDAGTLLPASDAGGEPGDLLLALGLALRSSDATGAGTQLNLIAPPPASVARRTARSMSLRYGVVMATILAVNLVAGLGLREVNARAAEGAATWQELAGTPSGSRSAWSAQVLAAKADVQPREVWPERWLELLGAVGGDDVQVTSLQLHQRSVIVTAAAAQGRAVERFKRAVTKYLPPPESPVVTLKPGTATRPAFTLTAQRSLPGNGPQLQPAGTGAVAPTILNAGGHDASGR